MLALESPPIAFSLVFAQNMRRCAIKVALSAPQYPAKDCCLRVAVNRKWGF